MTNETSNLESQETLTTGYPANTTVFSDGSTFDYENGYQSNGAPVATRDRTKTPTIIKSHTIATTSRVIGVIFSLLVFGVIAMCTAAALCVHNAKENAEAVEAGINNSGQVEFIGWSKDEALVKRPDGGIFKCEVSSISNHGNPTGLVFCSPGNPATFSIPLPYDPDNVFYNAPNEK